MTTFVIVLFIVVMIIIGAVCLGRGFDGKETETYLYNRESVGCRTPHQYSPTRMIGERHPGNVIFGSRGSSTDISLRDPYISPSSISYFFQE